MAYREVTLAGALGFWECTTCWALVRERESHDDWHRYNTERIKHAARNQIMERF